MVRFIKKLTPLLVAVLLMAGAVSHAMPEFQGVLSLGDYGGDVESLQADLKALGLYEGEVTGLFDSATEASVKVLQRLVGVKADGMFGPITYAAYCSALESEDILFKSVPVSAQARLVGVVIGIDPGHQRKPDLELEQLSPGSNSAKVRQSAGSVGVKTGVCEYRINLIISMKLKALLEKEGATVVLTRDSNDVALSNRERALLMNDAHVDFWLRIHCNCAISPRTCGMSVLIPAKSSSPSIFEQSGRLGRCIMESFPKATGTAALELCELTNQAGFNWSQCPVVTIELGYLSNPAEDVLLNRDSYQNACSVGLLNGILGYCLSE